jgi:uncharacterized protein (DUF1330 family)
MKTSREPLTLAFVGYASDAMAGRAVAYEDEVLALLADHGAKLLYRGRRVAGQDEALPLEVHLLWFPHRDALESYLEDDRRQALLRKHGDVFTSKQSVQVETVSADFTE